MELNEKEAHCIARLLQGGFLGRSKPGVRNAPFDGCTFCKYCYDEEEDGEICGRAEFAPFDKSLFYKKLMAKLENETGVDICLKPIENICLPLNFLPYKGLLKNCNERIKNYCEEYFSNLRQ